jgi:hypothetical protein
LAEQCIGITPFRAGVVQRREHRLLHLAGIIRPADQTILRAKSITTTFSERTVTFGISAKAQHVDDGELGREVEPDRLRRISSVRMNSECQASS